MDLQDVLKLDINNLKDKQYEALKEYSMKILNDIIALLNADKLQEIADRMKFSPSGDDFGTDHYFINFSYDNEDKDLYDIIYQMAKLKDKKIYIKDEN